ncbi:type II toxin-antitoxin system RelE/ParE family toxin [Variovorax beijingensis]|uniref:type II toxin-antitoxin system RelE/ParE family toxin n=1 Tax=Variovorax beijingensis TaxID=2496117 RepID=UPI003B845FC7
MRLSRQPSAGWPSTPLLGRAGQIPGTRELIPHESYRLVYEVRADTIWILTLVHTARQWPPTRS